MVQTAAPTVAVIHKPSVNGVLSSYAAPWWHQRSFVTMTVTPGRYGVPVNDSGMSEQRNYDLAFGERNRLV